MAGTKGNDNMSSNARSAGSRLLRVEGDLFDQGLLTGGWLRRVAKRNYMWIPIGQGSGALLGCQGGVVVVLRKAAFSSPKVALVAEKDANCC